MFVKRLRISERLGSTDEDSGRVILGMGDQVEHPVVAVGEVDIGVSGRAKHRVIFGSLTAKGMTARVIGSAVGFYLHDLDSSEGSDEGSPEDEGGSFFNSFRGKELAEIHRV